jgi:hypothetical protein
MAWMKLAKPFLGNTIYNIHPFQKLGNRKLQEEVGIRFGKKGKAILWKI